MYKRQIKTPINLNYQIHAQNALRSGIESYDKRHGWRGAITNKIKNPNWKKIIKNLRIDPTLNWEKAEITGINETTDGSMSYSTKLHLRDANTSGISTAYTYNSHATLSNSIALSTYGIDGAGSLHYQQVQISGGA